jgi:Ran-binding protein 1
MEKTPQPDIVEDGEDQVDENYNPEEEVFEGNWKIIDLPVVVPVTDDEHIETLWECKMLLYRWDKDQWKERAKGEFKFIREKKSTKIRGVLRQATTNKVMGNFFGRTL